MRSCYLYTIVIFFVAIWKTSTLGQAQTGQGQGFILLLPQADVLPRSDSGSDVKPALSFIIQNCQTSCSMWCHTHNSWRTKSSFVLGRMELPNTSPQAIELNASCLGKAHSKKPGTGSRYENMEPGCILAVLCIPSIVHSLRSVDAKSSKVV